MDKGAINKTCSAQVKACFKKKISDVRAQEAVCRGQEAETQASKLSTGDLTVTCSSTCFFGRLRRRNLDFSLKMSHNSKSPTKRKKTDEEKTVSIWKF